MPVSWNDGDAGNRMNLDPLTMESVLHQGSHDANVGAHSGERDVILVIGACSHSVRRLTDVKSAHDFEHQITAFMVRVSGVQEILKFGIHLEPPVSVSIILVADSIGLSPGGHPQSSRLQKCTADARSDGEGGRRDSTECHHRYPAAGEEAELAEMVEWAESSKR